MSGAARLRSTTAAAVAAGVVAGLALSARPSVIASTPACDVPSISGISPHVAHQGVTVTVTGSNFAAATSVACNFSVSVGGEPVSTQSRSNTSFTFTAQSSRSGGPVNGGVVVALTDPVLGNSNTSNGNQVFGTIPQLSGLSPGNPAEGQLISLSGSGFTFRTAGGALAPPAAVTFFSGGVCQVQAPGSIGDTGMTVPAPGRYCNGPVQLSFQLVVDQASGATQTVVADGNPSIDIAPVVSGITPGDALPGARVTVSGSGLGNSGSATLGGLGAAAAWSDHSVAVTVPSAATSGALSLVRSADGAQIAAGSITVDARITSLSPGTVGVGEPLTINGLGFGPQRGSVHLGSLELPVSQWSPTAIGVTIPVGAVSGQLAVSPVGNAAPAPVGLTIVARLTRVSPSHGLPGALVQVEGTSLGNSAGTATVAGRAAEVSLWADQQVALAIPLGVRTGRTSIVLTPPGGVAASIDFTVDAGPSPSPAAAAAALAASGAAPPPIPPSPGGPIVTHGGTVDFQPRRKPPSPINLTLTPSADHGEPGSTVQLTGTLVAFGKPVRGATVELLVVVEPNSDALISPAKAVTDAGGSVHGSLRLSSTPGDHIILARSGLYSDEIRIRGGNEEALAGGAASAVRSSVTWAVSAALVLFVLGLGLNLITSHGAALAAAGIWRARAPGPRGAVTALGRASLAVLRAALVGWRAAGRRLIVQARSLGVHLRNLRRASGPPPLPPA